MPNRQNWIAFLLAAASLAAAQKTPDQPPCPNLSGNYVAQGEDGQVHIAITQHECDRIEIIRKSNYLGTMTSETHSLMLDGKERKDSPWLGGAEQDTTSARFIGSQLQVTTRTNRGSTLTMVYSLNAARDLVEEARGRGGPRVAKRQQ